MTIALLAPLLLAAGTADVSTLDCAAIVAKTDYTDDTDACLTQPMTKAAFEEGMTCIGKFDGYHALAVRITESIAEDKREGWTKQIAGNDGLAKDLAGLLAQSKDDPDLDHAAGQAAYDAAHAPYDAALSLGGPEQLKQLQAEPQISKRCLDMANFFSANLATRKGERDRNAPDNQ